MKYFISPCCFSSSPLLLVEHSHSVPEGRAAILVSCPAETISGNITKSKDKLLNMTKKKVQYSQGLSPAICEIDRKKQIGSKFCAVPSFFDHEEFHVKVTSSSLFDTTQTSIVICFATE